MSATRLAIAGMNLLGKLPLPVLRGIGKGIGRFLFVVARQRRRIALRNFELCFPEVPEAQRKAWARESFEVFCQTFLDRSWLWSGPLELVRSRLKVTGALDALEGDQPTIIFAPHFYGMDAGGAAVLQQTQRESTSIFATHPDPYIDAWLKNGRQRFGRVRMLNRVDGVKPIISSLRQGGLLYLLPDMDYGRTDTVFVPYFAVQETATIPSLSRFARLGRARVIAVYTRMTPEGYVAEVTPFWENFPTDDIVADTARMNRELEAAIRTMPAQYYWVHKRFKTRPEGQPSLYKKT